MIRVGRFRILFTAKGSMVRWYTLSMGYEGKQIRTWRERIRIRAVYGRRIATRRLVRECCGIIILGMALGHLIRLFAEAL